MTYVYSTASSAMETGESSSQGANGKYGDSLMSPASFELSAAPTITTRSDRTWKMSLAQRLLPLFSSSFTNLTKAPSPPIPAGSPRLEVPHFLRKNHGIKVSVRKVGQVYVYNVRSATAAGVRNPHHNDTSLKLSVDTRVRILVIPGGGFRSKPTKAHWRLCEHLATTFPYDMVTLISPPLAPKSTAPEVFPILLETYKMLAREATGIGEHVALVGDSSGGNLALSIAIAALGESERVFKDYGPMHIVLISPLVDLSPPSSSSPEKSPTPSPSTPPKDPILSPSTLSTIAQSYTGTWALSDPRVSPINADLTLLRQAGTRLHVIAGSYDTGYLAVVQLKEMCERTGVRGDWLLWERQVHCFPLVGWGWGVKEGVEGRGWVVDRLRGKEGARKGREGKGREGKGKR
jgi:acetyl esterase/lipase